MAKKTKSTKKTTPKLSARARKALDKAASHSPNDPIPAFLKDQKNPSEKPRTASEIKAADEARQKRWDAVIGGMTNSLIKAAQRSEQAQFFGFLLDHINIVVMGHMLTYIAIALNVLGKYQLGVAYGVAGLAFAYFAVIQRRADREKFSGFLVFLSQAAVIASYAFWFLSAVLVK